VEAEKMKKIVLLVMTEKGFEVVKRAIEVRKDIIDFIVIGTDSNVENDFSEQIIELARSENVKFFLRNKEPSVDDDTYIFAISWRWMISHPMNKLVVFHDSILPKYRGFVPLVNMLINGESQIGVSAIFGSSEYDRGYLIAQKSSKIEYPITIFEAIQLNNQNFIALVEEIILKILDGENLVGTPQNENEATYSIWRDTDDYRIDWSKSSDEIKRFIDAVGSPYLGASTSTSRGEDVRVLEAEVIDDVFCELRHVGKVIFITDGLPTVICGKGLLRINRAHLVGLENETYLPMKSFRVKFL
jgi:methionyl-tRNA formyltransferase